MSFIAQTNSWSDIAIGEHLQAFSPMIAMVCTMLAIVACPILLSRNAKTVGTVATLGIIVTGICVWRLAGSVSDVGMSGLSTDPGAAILLSDKISVGYQAVLIAFLAAVTWLWWIGSAAKEENAPEFFILLIGSALGMALMASTANLLMIAIAIEAASLPSYAIVGFDKRDRRAAEASLKYMIFGAVSAAMMLYGISLLYGLAGSLDFATVASYAVQAFTTGQNQVVFVVALLCFFAGIAFKISAVPFHFWCPDAFEGAKIEVTTWLSVASKAAALVLLMRLVTILCHAVDSPYAMDLITPIAWAIAIFAAVTCTVGNFSAYRQQNIKRMLAYSSIAHAGYMMMATAVFLHPSAAGAQAGFSALMMYIVIYMFMNLGAFGVTALVGWETGSDDIESFNGLMRRAPFLAVPMIVCLVSLVGLPPFAGFMGKWWILVALGSLDSTLGWFLVAVAVFNTLFSLYYYMRVVVQMCLRDTGQQALSPSPAGLTLVNVCAAVLVAMFVFASPMHKKTDELARGVYQVRMPNLASNTTAHHEAVALSEQTSEQR